MRIAVETYAGPDYFSTPRGGSGSPYTGNARASARSTSALGVMAQRMEDSLQPVRRVDAAALIRGDFRPVAEQANLPVAPTVLTNYAKGPVGFLQWLAAVHPQLYDGVRKYHPELLVQANTINAQMEAAQKGLAGLGDWTDSISSWVTSASSLVGNLANTYTSVRQATAHPQIQQQLQQAAVVQQPVNYGNAPPIPPGSTAVTTPMSGSKMALYAGIGAVVVIGGLLVLKKK